MNRQQNKAAMIRHRLEQAATALRSAEAIIALDAGGAINRTYYAMFYAVHALALQEEYHGKTHTGLLRWFQKEYVATGKLPLAYSTMLRAAFTARMESDYEDYTSKDVFAAKHLLSKANDFIREVTTFITDY